MLCVFVLPFSNWRWATVCLSESMAALRRGVQRALFQLGRVPELRDPLVFSEKCEKSTCRGIKRWGSPVDAG
ncbi:MAG: hypothetical protein IT374_12990, partial [Polyangiaceae bacterium]|nr:hypothetical protein [Polyangiaceae bacterium]